MKIFRIFRQTFSFTEYRNIDSSSKESLFCQTEFPVVFIKITVKPRIICFQFNENFQNISANV
ncbi:hypothetical protein IX324_001992 [Bacteroides pyogenes]|nr:hypothetical protein [Bacteroides pyogenes]